MKPVWERHKVSPRLVDAMKAAGVTYDQLPLLPPYLTDEGKSTLCWNFLLGICTFPKCGRVSGHVAPKDLPLDWVKAACVVLAPVVAELVKLSPRKKQKTGG